MLLLDAHPVLAADEIADVARVVAFSLARLHAAGQVHGAVDLQHVSADAAGAVSLLPGPAVGTAEDDVRALGDLILDLLSSAHPRPVEGPAVARPAGSPPSLLDRLLGRGQARHRRLARAAPSAEEALAAIARQASPEDGSAPPSAAAVAALVALRVPHARPPGRRPPPVSSALGQAAAVSAPVVSSPVASGSRLVVSRAGAVFAALTVFAIVLVALSAIQGRRSRPAELAPLPAALPASSSSSIEGPEGRFAVGSPDDVVLVDDWFCRGSPVPALLRPSTGEVFVFDRWPESGEELAGRAVGVVPGAHALDASGTPSCPGLLAVTETRSVALPVQPVPGGSVPAAPTAVETRP